VTEANKIETLPQDVSIALGGTVVANERERHLLPGFGGRTLE